MAFLIATLAHVLVGLAGFAASLVGLLIGGVGSVLGLGFAFAICAVVLLGILLSPWFLLGFALWIVWKFLGSGNPRRRTWTVVR